MMALPRDLPKVASGVHHSEQRLDFGSKVILQQLGLQPLLAQPQGGPWRLITALEIAYAHPAENRMNRYSSSLCSVT
jgi:hypothetical protein